MKIIKDLSPLQEKIYKAFKAKDEDVTIRAVYCMVYGHEARRAQGTTQRIMQQKLAPNIALLNEKLEGGRIEPGKLKGTYRLNTKGE